MYKFFIVVCVAYFFSLSSNEERFRYAVQNVTEDYFTLNGQDFPYDNAWEEVLALGDFITVCDAWKEPITETSYRWFFQVINPQTEEPTYIYSRLISATNSAVIVKAKERSKKLTAWSDRYTASVEYAVKLEDGAEYILYYSVDLDAFDKSNRSQKKKEAQSFLKSMQVAKGDVVHFKNGSLQTTWRYEADLYQNNHKKNGYVVLKGLKREKNIDPLPDNHFRILSVGESNGPSLDHKPYSIKFLDFAPEARFILLDTDTSMEEISKWDCLQFVERVLEENNQTIYLFKHPSNPTNLILLQN